MKAIAIEMGRTGSTSLTLALEKLGYRCFHDDEYTYETGLMG